MQFTVPQTKQCLFRTHLRKLPARPPSACALARHTTATCRRRVGWQPWQSCPGLAPLAGSALSLLFLATKHIFVYISLKSLWLF